MTPYFFGCSTQQLFGVYHAPTSGEIRDKAILICPPIGHEYMRTHWALRRLAEQLSHIGFHVLRFDYFGTGDSAGDSREASIKQWQEDILTAAEELKDMAATRNISIVAMRLGAALVMTNKRLKSQDLIFWEPVISGQHYLTELKNAHYIFLKEFNHTAVTTPNNEFVGQYYNNKLINDLNKIDCHNEAFNTKKIETIYSAQPEDSFERTVKSQKISYKNHIIEDAGQWGTLTALGAAVLPTKTINTIVTALKN